MRRVAPALAAAVALAACGSSSLPVDQALRERLEGFDLSVQAIACVDSRLEYNGEPVFRCTVNFGDPHIVPYCAAIVEGALATDREEDGMRCYRPEDEERYRGAALLR